jgi:hypothetical protein
MAYTGLIISHNGCLKINDTLSEELKFNPKCIKYLGNTEFEATYKNSLIFEYNSSVLEDDRQKIFEIGEVNSNNCSNDYPYAMALKRCMDRVILKNSKLAYSGVYSDSEAEEFVNQQDGEEKKEEKFIPATEKQLEMIQSIFSDRVDDLVSILSGLNKKKIIELSIQEASEIIKGEK